MNYFIFTTLYLFTSYALFRIARTLMHSRAWMAAIPFAREWLLISLVGRSWKWFVLILIPVVNFVACWVVWGELARKLNRSTWLGRMMVVPIANLFVLAMLAFGITRGDILHWCITAMKKLIALLSKKRSENLEPVQEETIAGTKQET